MSEVAFSRSGAFYSALVVSRVGGGPNKLSQKAISGRHDSSPDSGVRNDWVTSCKTYGRAHKMQEFDNARDI